MKKTKISSSQLFYTIICYIQSFSIVMNFSFGISGRDTWFALLLGSGIAFLSLRINIAIMQHFPGKTLVEINSILYGRKVGKILSLFYLLYFLFLSSVNLHDIGDFVGLSILPETPTVVILVSFMIVCGWAVMKGLRVIVRYSAAFSWITFIAFIVTTILVSSKVNWHNLLPVLTTAPKSILQSAWITSFIPLSSAVLQMVAPNVCKPNEISKILTKGLWTGSLFMIAVIIRDTAVWGNMAKSFVVPAYETLRLSGFSEVFQGMDVVYAVILITLEFFKIALLESVLLSGFSQLTNQKSHPKIMAVIVSVLMALIASQIFPSIPRHIVFAQKTEPFILSIFEFFLPCISLLRIKWTCRSRS
ncbi:MULTISPECIES: GerAB/ArcD/ProY family transporter [Caproicibacterium]|uniref:Endospore germination permease n=1 Tax=Caproicibacterium lactatifermentans TaxID=2666138 RepID=A0A859DQW6_9FIRM|nr:endospore germination permease [Caproicibacterium lactatifermentans]ARP50019.1 hypothetical protein B6259_03475 [Ruminococcaceae bacterium CPB6]QKN24200.1 endospore germination permease [Caproicibacterium lactatifermentans]QKO30731.1 endospore germination permease [Caproicibacterium lactatifermentans]